MLVERRTVESEAISHFGSLVTILKLVRVGSLGVVVAHVLDQVGLEYFFSNRLLALVPHGAAEVFLIDRGATVVSKTSLHGFLVLILDAESIEHEHPLVHLEFVNVELRHEFDNLDGLL